MNYVDGDEPPPPDLTLAFYCGDHHLPDAGAIHDQNYATLTRMRAVYNIWHTLARLRNMVGAEIHTLTNEERRILGNLKDLGLLYG